MSAAERVRGDDWSLLCSPNFSDFCPAATGLAIQHPWFPLRAFAPSSFDARKRNSNFEIAIRVVCRTTMQRSIHYLFGLVIRSFRGSDETQRSLKTPLGQDKATWALTWLVFALFGPIWRQKSRQTCPNFGAFLASLSRNITNNNR